jgi:hypothetical protein
MIAAIRKEQVGQETGVRFSTGTQDILTKFCLRMPSSGMIRRAALNSRRFGGTYRFHNQGGKNG